MGITTTRFVKKPLYVEAVNVTKENFSEVTKWCRGKTKTESNEAHKASGQKFIKIETHNPINTRQTKAYIGDWILKTERGFKIYTQKAFEESFDPVSKDNSVEAQVRAFDEQDNYESCASPRALHDPGVPQ